MHYLQFSDRPVLVAKIGTAGLFWQQNWSGGPVLAKFSAKIGLAGPILGETNLGVTCQSLLSVTIE